MQLSSADARLGLAFTMMGGADWSVGPVYLANLVRAARAAAGSVALGLYSLATAGDPRADAYARSVGTEGVIWHLTARRAANVRASDKLARALAGRDLWLERTLLGAGVDVLFSQGLEYRLGRVATLGWLPDFQHRHLPELFSSTERRARDRLFVRTAQRATLVVVISDAVKNDFCTFLPRYGPSVRVLKPISYVAPATYATDPAQVTHRYSLPDQFVYVPNQFWVHKNHTTLFEAVSILRRQGVKVNVVCTGPKNDYRHPGYFEQLMARVSEWGIADSVFALGLIPREDVATLMRQSVAVVSPSAFEGWGYAVEEARALGKRVLLSDIPTHREQAPPMALYFDPHNSEELADRLGSVWRQTPPGPDARLEEQARAGAELRLREYGAAFLTVAREAVAVNSLRCRPRA